MSHIPSAVSSPGKQKNGRPHLPSWAKGLLVGEAVWGVSFLGMLLFELLETLQLPDFVSLLGSIFAVAAAPVTLGGWMFLWGDNGPPYAWIDSWAFIIGFGICFYGSLGVLMESLWRHVFRR